MPQKPTKTLHEKRIDYRAHPEAYVVGRGEQGVLTVEPYKSEILPHWRFKTPAIAERSAQAIMALYEAYKARQDFVGMDMARKFLQMGYTRSRRYANHANGRKVAPDGSKRPLENNAEKALCADIFANMLKKVKNDPHYQSARANHKLKKQT